MSETEGVWRDPDWVRAAIRACEGFPLETLESIPAGDLYRIYLLQLSMPAKPASSDPT